MMSSVLDLSALHEELPTECVSANILVNLEQPQYPGIFGTGFFAKIKNQIFYFTALHCLRTNPGAEAVNFSTLMIPYRHTGTTASPDDFIQVETAFTIGGDHADKWDDMVACPILPAKRPKDFEHLLTRSVNLPASGQWLEQYVSSEIGQAAIAAGLSTAYVVGCPRQSPRNEIRYADEDDGESIVSSEVALLEGIFTVSEQPGFYQIRFENYCINLSGFSGSPVFAPINTATGRRFALLGMVVCGSAKALNFLPVSRLLAAAIGDEA